MDPIAILQAIIDNGFAENNIVNVRCVSLGTVLPPEPRVLNGMQILARAVEYLVQQSSANRRDPRTSSTFVIEPSYCWAAEQARAELDRELAARNARIGG